MSNDRSLDQRRQLIDEIWEEISSLNGKQLDGYLASVGFEPNDLLQDYSKAMEAAIAAPKRARFEEARRLVRVILTATVKCSARLADIIRRMQ